MPTNCTAERVAVSVTLFLITFLPISSQINIFYSWLHFHQKLYYLLPYNISIISIHYNYWSAMLLNPGTVPIKYEPPPSSKLFELKSSNSLRYCKKCNNYKPPRSHHCSECNKCILKMDHHCAWVGNCIGSRNQPFFYRFLASVVFATGYGLILIFIRLYSLYRLQQSIIDSYTDFNAEIYSTLHLSDAWEIFYILINAILMLIVFLLVGIMFIYQTYYISKNTTTIESFELDKINDLVRRGKISLEDSINPYDLGFIDNFRSVFGNTYSTWLFTPQFSGLEFQINESCIEVAKRNRKVLTWPPEEYLEFKRTGVFDYKGSKHVRRGSEGYIVRDISMQDRQEMVNEQMNIEQSYSESSFSEEDEPLGALKSRIANRKSQS